MLRKIDCKYDNDTGKFKLTSELTIWNKFIDGYNYRKESERQEQVRSFMKVSLGSTFLKNSFGIL